MYQTLAFGTLFLNLWSQMKILFPQDTWQEWQARLWDGCIFFKTGEKMSDFWNAQAKYDFLPL